MTRVPFMDPAAQTASLQPELGEAVARVLASGQYVLGENVAAFERELAAFCGARHAVAVASGTDALALALQALGIGEGDEVITTPFTFVATAEAIHRVGAKVVFADIDAESFHMDPRAVAPKITRRTRALLPVHLFGLPAPMDEILALARKRKLVVVEDAAQAMGAQFRGRRVGTLGDAGALSFYPTKNLAAAGDAGAVLTDSGKTADALRALRVHGQRRRYRFEFHGLNSRLDEIQAAILRLKLRHLDQWNARRRQIAALYRRELAGLRGQVTLPGERDGCEHVHSVFTIRVPAKRRHALARHLTSRGIGTSVFYPKPLHLQPVFRALKHGVGDFPEAERAARESLALPLYPELSGEQAAAVCASVKEFFSGS